MITDPAAILFVLAIAVAVAVTLEHHTKVFRALGSALVGILLGMLFGMANTYLGLKAGLTISTSIPVAVLSVVFFRVLGMLGGRHSILELNTSQTVGSASSSV